MMLPAILKRHSDIKLTARNKLKIMRTQLLIFATIISFTSYGQTSVYHPFPDSSAIWNISAQGCCWNLCPSPPTVNPVLGDFNFSYSIIGDTIINSITYHKLLKSGTEHEHCAFGNFIDNWYSFSDYVGAFRQDTAMRKLFLVMPSNNTECLLYDFNLTVGDSVGGGCLGFSPCAAISSIDSILIGNSLRRRFNLSTPFPYTIIEGIGSTSGLLEPLCPFEYSGTLKCFSQNGETLYPDTVTSCQLLTSIKNVSANSSSTKVFPNPFHTSTTFEVNSDFKNAELKIYNTFGVQVRQVKITSQNTTINRDELSDGIYFFKAISKSGRTLNGKFIVQ